MKMYDIERIGKIISDIERYFRDLELDRLSRNYPTTNRNYTIVQKSKKRFLSNSMHIYSRIFLKLQKYHLEECVS
ncbi:hypothetical protein C5S29_08265 [ANME-1 cluster archaeon GoMg3.2]|nr:hypothetical protein [ANME-1 cluster archaeon GoMg3.2]